jgi:hypothetical protein
LFVKNVMVHQANLLIVLKHCAEMLTTWNFVRSRELLEFKNLLDVGKIRLISVLRVILHHVTDRCWLALSVKSVPIMGEHYDDEAAGPHNPFPFLQCIDGVGRMLKRVGGQKKSLAAVLDVAQIRGFSNEVHPFRLARMLKIRASFATRVFPIGLLGQNAVVNLRRVSVDGKDARILKSPAWTSNFKSGTVFYESSDAAQIADSAA